MDRKRTKQANRLQAFDRGESSLLISLKMCHSKQQGLPQMTQRLITRSLMAGLCLANGAGRTHTQCVHPAVLTGFCVITVGDAELEAEIQRGFRALTKLILRDWCSGAVRRVQGVLPQLSPSLACWQPSCLLCCSFWPGFLR